MATFAAYVVVHGADGPVQFEPGAEVPGWAESLVGSHVIDGDFAPEPEEPAEDAEDPEEPAKPAAAAPDFTGSKPRRARQPRG